MGDSFITLAVKPWAIDAEEFSVAKAGIYPALLEGSQEKQIETTGPRQAVRLLNPPPPESHYYQRADDFGYAGGTFSWNGFLENEKSMCYV